MKKGIIFDKSKKAFPIIVMAIGIILALALQIMRLNMVAVVNVAFMCIVVALMMLGLFIFKKLYVWNFITYGINALSVVLYYTIWGADAGFGAFTSGKAGWASVEHALTSGADSANFLIRLGGNLLLLLPCIIMFTALLLVGKKQLKNKGAHVVVTSIISILLAGTSAFYVITMNLRSEPNVERLWDGHNDYLDGVDEAAEGKPNVLFIMMDDLG